MTGEIFETRELRGAAGDALSSRAIAEAAALSVNAPNPRLKKVRRHLRDAANLISAGEYRAAGAEAVKALDLDEKNSLANHLAAIAMDRLGEVVLSLKFYQRAIEFEPGNPEIYENLALLAWRYNMLDMAERFIRLQLQIEPASPTGLNNLGCVLRDREMINDSIEVLRSAIYQHQSDPLLWSSLAVTMLEDLRLKEAMQFYEESIRLAPNNARMHHNLGHALYFAGEPERSVAHFQNAMRLEGLPADERIASEHALSFSLLSCGRLEEGWRAYETRNHPLNSQHTDFWFDTAEWKEQPLEGKKLILVGEQGLGDEVLFASAIDDIRELVGADGELAFACEQRLVPLMRRSFPGVRIEPHDTALRMNRKYRSSSSLGWGKDWDYWTPMANPLKRVRTSVSDFAPPPEGFLKPDPDRVAHWKDELAKLGDGPKVGILWKSQVMNLGRRKSFSPFDAWRDVLQTRGVTFVNLQYGDCEDELKKAKNRFDVDIHVLDGIDLKQDLDDICALSAALDLLIGPMNATTNIAAGAGAPVWLVWARGAWTYLGTDCTPWYPKTRTFSPDSIADWRPCMAHVAGELERFAATGDPRTRGSADAPPTRSAPAKHRLTA